MTTTKTRRRRAPARPAGLCARLLCGIDGSPESIVAARQATTLVEDGGSVEFLAAVSPAVTAPPVFGASAVVHELEEAAEEALGEVATRWPQATTKIRYGAASEALLAEAGERDATLLVVGSHGRRRLPGILLGSVATHVLHRAACSVLVARERDLGIAFPRAIVAGTDGSEAGGEAVRVAKALGERFGAPVRVLAATGGDPVDVDGLSLLPGIEWSRLPPVEALTAAARGADLVVVGNRGLRGVRALGSVGERLGHTAPCSVLVVRRS